MGRLILLQNVFREVFDDENLTISPDTTRADIEGWDSVAQVKLVVMLESELDFRFDNDEVSDIKSIGQLLGLLDKHLG